jgi:hypothetical protein
MKETRLTNLPLVPAIIIDAALRGVAHLFSTIWQPHPGTGRSIDGGGSVQAPGLVSQGLPLPPSREFTGDPRMLLTLKDMPHYGIPQRRLDGDWYVTGEMRDHYSGGAAKSRWNKKGEHFVGGKNVGE